MHPEGGRPSILERLKQRREDERLGVGGQIVWLDDQSVEDQIQILGVQSAVDELPTQANGHEQVEGGKKDDLFGFVQAGRLPPPGEYRTEFKITYGETGSVTAEVYIYNKNPEDVGVDAVSGATLHDGDLVVRIGSSGPITWNTFRALVEQSGGEYFTGININIEDVT